MILIRNLRLGTDEAIGALPEKAAKKLRIAPERIESWQLVKKSLDARKKDDLHYVCAVAAEIRGSVRVKDRDVSDYVPPRYEIPRIAASSRPVVVGFGPAGMFAALVLAKAGARPIAGRTRRRASQLWRPSARAGGSMRRTMCSSARAARAPSPTGS